MSIISDILTQSMQSNINSGAYAVKPPPQTGQSADVSYSGSLSGGGPAGGSLLNNVVNPNGNGQGGLAQNIAQGANTQGATQSAGPNAPPPPPTGPNGEEAGPATADAPSATPTSLSGLIGSGIRSLISSDENLKTNIQDVDPKDIDAFIQSLSPKSFDYKDKQDGSRTESGVIAQDMEKSKIGKNVVVNTPRGKAIDANKLSALTAGIFSNKIRELEDKVNQSLNQKFKKGK